MKRVIDQELANHNIEFVLKIRGINFRKGWFGLTTGEEDDFAYISTRVVVDYDASQEYGRPLWQISFVCGNRQMKEMEPGEMRKCSAKLIAVASAVERLNEMFQDVLVEVEHDD